jgi:hypothetical protein
MTIGRGWSLVLWVSSKKTEEERKLIKEIKEAGIPCEICDSPYIEEPVLYFASYTFLGYTNIRWFIKDWERVWKQQYEQRLKEDEELRQLSKKMAENKDRSV